jgi:hypothetical protein
MTHIETSNLALKARAPPTIARTATDINMMSSPFLYAIRDVV